MGASGVIFMVVYALAVVAEFYFVPMYLKAVWPEKSMRSLKYKMVCSALFMLAALCCMFYSNNYTSYTAFMLTGLAFGLVGDLLIHYPTPKKAITALGGVSFFIGHIFYIAAFSVTMKNYFPQAKVLDYRAVTVILALAGIGVIIALAKKIKFGIFAVPVLFYTVVLVTMLVTAFQLTIRLQGTLSVAVTVMLGALLFVLSDATIVFLLFGGQEKNRPLKVFNITTYFLGQILLGTSILFIQS